MWNLQGSIWELPFKANAFYQGKWWGMISRCWNACFGICSRKAKACLARTTRRDVKPWCKQEQAHGKQGQKNPESRDRGSWKEWTVSLGDVPMSLLRFQIKSFFKDANSWVIPFGPPLAGGSMAPSFGWSPSITAPTTGYWHYLTPSPPHTHIPQELMQFTYSSWYEAQGLAQITHLLNVEWMVCW